METIKSEQGVCPKCGSEDLDYGVMELMEESIFYPYTCNKCGFRGKEWYSVTFSEHQNEDNPDEVFLKNS